MVSVGTVVEICVGTFKGKQATVILTDSVYGLKVDTGRLADEGFTKWYQPHEVVVVLHKNIECPTVRTFKHDW